MEQMDYGYGLWFAVAINSLLFILFAYTFTKLETKRDWRTFGAFSAFVIAYFAEMYGFPLTIYIFSGWLSQHYPSINIYGHDSGHLLHTLLGLKGNPHFDILHILSIIIIGYGLYLLSSAWRTLYTAQKKHKLAVTGLYKKVRHPQYDGFILIMIGFLLQWPTLLTLIMFPILLIMYVRLARKEENEVKKEFGEQYERYALKTPAFIPNFRKN